MTWHVPEQVWSISVGAGVILFAWAGVALTAFTLPGIWLALLGAGLAQWWSIAQRSDPGGAGMMFSWWSLGACVALGVIAELVELIASAYGAKKAGGSKMAALASILGALVGAIAGSFVFPVVGTIIGAALGAGVGALLTERHLGEKTWAESGKVGAGAAAGRFVATIVKLAIAALIAVILTIDVLV